MADLFVIRTTKDYEFYNQPRFKGTRYYGRGATHGDFVKGQYVANGQQRYRPFNQARFFATAEKAESFLDKAHYIPDRTFFEVKKVTVNPPK